MMVAGGLLSWPASRSGSRNGIYIDAHVADHLTTDAHPLFNMIDRHAVQVQLPATAGITAQGKAATVAEQRSGFIDPAPYSHIRHGHLSFPLAVTPR